MQLLKESVQRDTNPVTHLSKCREGLVDSCSLNKSLSLSLSLGDALGASKIAQHEGATRDGACHLVLAFHRQHQHQVGTRTGAWHRTMVKHMEQYFRQCFYAFRLG